MNKTLKRIILNLFLALSISTILMFVYEFYPKLPSSIDNRLRDSFFIFRGEEKNSENVVIIDIDEKSINELGQWPWSRDVMADILNKLNDLQVGLIAFDIVFAEKDRTSPHRIFKKYNVKNIDVKNYDVEFAKAIANSPTILGYQFELEKKEFLNKTHPDIRGVYNEIGKSDGLGDEYITKAHGTILNTPIIQNNGYTSGFFNNIPDDSGIIRSVPLIISYENFIYPSLALEVLRIALDAQEVQINYDSEGVASISINENTIPTDRYGRMYVNFRGGEKNFKYIPAVDIYKNKVKQSDIEGKITLIGTSAAGLLDLRATPFESIYPGVEVHANLIDNVLMEDYIYIISDLDVLNILIIYFLSILTIFLLSYSPYWSSPFIVVFLLTSSLYSIYYILFNHGPILNIFFPILTIVTSSIAVTLFDYFYTIKQEKQLKKKFASKVSKDVMEALLKSNDDNFQAEQKEVTVFFSDLRDFTKISEEMNNAEKLIEYLNNYMDPMSNIIIKNQGTIDKYIGDAIMAYWNAPLNVKNHEDKAVQTAIEQINYLDTLNKKLKKENKPLINIGVGINTGDAIVGEMGSLNRSDYTVIGDAVNLGSRLESLCKYYDSKINISNFTKNRLKEKYIFRFLDYVTVKGKEKPIEIWQVIPEKLTKELEEEIKVYHEAIELYKISEFKKALEIFKQLEENENKSNKNIYKIYILRCEDYIKNPPKNFNGIYMHSSKS